MRFCTAIALVSLCAAPLTAQSKLSDWPQHSEDRPRPRVVEPGAVYTIAPPADATVLFGGTSLDKWASANGASAKWRVVDGAFEAVPGTGQLSTRDGFGDVQLHIEWASPKPAVGTGQDRGNSGVFMADGRYEVQVLDSRNNVTYADGQAGALYGQFPPLVNATRAPGEWQAYDIVYAAPRFNEHGTLVKPGYITVLHNGVLVQNHTELLGDTVFEHPPSYHAHGAAPIRLQFHGNPIRFRNIWLRELQEQQPQRPE